MNASSEILLCSSEDEHSSRETCVPYAAYTPCGLDKRNILTEYNGRRRRRPSSLLVDTVRPECGPRRSRKIHKPNISPQFASILELELYKALASVSPPKEIPILSRRPVMPPSKVEIRHVSRSDFLSLAPLVGEVRPFGKHGLQVSGPPHNLTSVLGESWFIRVKKRWRGPLRRRGYISAMERTNLRCLHNLAN